MRPAHGSRRECRARREPVISTRVSAQAQPYPLWPGLRTFVAANLIGFAGTIAVTVAVLMIRPGWAGRSAQAMTLKLLAECGFYAVAVPYALGALRRLSGGSLREAGLRAPRLRDGVLALAALAVTLAADAALTFVLDRLHQTHVQAGFGDFHVRTPLEVGLAIALIGFAGPISEELIFRGILFRTLAARFPLWAATALSAGVFAAMHGDPVLFVNLGIMGALAALLYARSGGLAAPMMFHSAGNLITLAAALVSGEWR